MRRNRAMAKNAALLAASVMVWCGGANATPSCQGTYAATPLQPLPERVVLDLDLHDRSKRSLVLADSHVAAVRRLGPQRDWAFGQDLQPIDVGVPCCLITNIVSSK